MASRSSTRSSGPSNDEIGEQLEELEKRLERAKVLYEQYFMGIQKIPPGQLHRDLERRIRELTQRQIRNTALRFRFTTLSQKFGSYNTYWKRTMRQIEQGTYLRDLAKMGRQANRSGEEVPEEVLAKMPKRMRDRILRDRERIARRREREEQEEAAAIEANPQRVRDNKPKNVHQISEADLMEDVDLDAIFSGMMADDAPPPEAAPPKAAPTPPPQVAPQAKPVARGTPPPRDPSAPPRATRAAPPPGMSDAEAKQLYHRYVKARELVGDRTDNLSYGKLMRSLNKQAPKILSDHQASGVSFNVVVKGDKVVLKAKPKK